MADALPCAFQDSPAVEKARSIGRPLVALESTIIAHGLPWPDNFQTVQAMSEAVRDQGAEPAVIAVVEGVIRIGLDEAELEGLARGGFRKASARDLAAALAQGANAATTVSSTLFLAARAGIPIMATGGIGGVHRDSEASGDVSADLLELGRTPATVVCSGAKSILDLPRTVEYLETQGVPTVGVGTAEWPSFYTRRSGIPLEHRIDTPDEAAEIIKACRRLDLPAALLVLNPVPEDQALDHDELEGLIETALREARKKRITGKETTPFLLSRLLDLSQGKTLRANKALAVDNARLAARISRALGTT